MTARCKSCGAPIVFGSTAKLQAIPLNAAEDSEGNCILGPDGRVIVNPEVVPNGWTRHRSHFQTCPNAAEHRRPRRPSARRAGEGGEP